MNSRKTYIVTSSQTAEPLVEPFAYLNQFSARTLRSMRHHVLLDVSCHQHHFFTRIKDVQWIESLFGTRKKLEHPRAKHEREIWGADEGTGNEEMGTGNGDSHDFLGCENDENGDRRMGMPENGDSHNFLGRPAERRVDWRLYLSTIVSIHRSLPYGTPLFTEVRSAVSSSSFSVALIHMRYP